MKMLRDFIAGQDRQDYLVPIDRISLSEEGVLQAGRFEGRITESALRGLLKIEGVPADFVLKDCPGDLLALIVRRMARERKVEVRIQAVNGTATAITPANRQILQNAMLIDCLGLEKPIKEAVLSTDYLRITGVQGIPREVLPGDPFEYGWEVTNKEDGWHSTEVLRLAVRQICSNGMVGFESRAVYQRRYNSKDSLFNSLQELKHIIDTIAVPDEIEPAVKWAADNKLGTLYTAVMNYLSQKLQGNATSSELLGINSETTWFELMNRITALARMYSLEVRRQYELEGGLLLRWFSRQGRGRAPWQKRYCHTCDHWSNGG